MTITKTKSGKNWKISFERGTVYIPKQDYDVDTAEDFAKYGKPVIDNALRMLMGKITGIGCYTYDRIEGARIYC